MMQDTLANSDTSHRPGSETNRSWCLFRSNRTARPSSQTLPPFQQDTANHYIPITFLMQAATAYMRSFLKD